MSRQRAQRIGEEIKKEVSEIIRLELKDPALEKMTSITGADVSRDLSHVKVYVSIFAPNTEQDKVLKVLEKASGFIRSELGKRIRLRHTPEIEFRLDRSMEYGAHIDGVLKRLELSPKEGEAREE
ncbi:MAG: 30S ribosome-binding factor RbfA [Bacillota bacterium]